MIVRDFIYAEKPRTLQNTVAASPARSAVAAVSIVSALNISAPAAVPQMEKLSIGQVMEWLDSQDDAVRLMVANNLSDEIEQVRDEAIIAGRAAGTNAARAEFNSQCASALGALRMVASKCEELFVQQRDDLAQQCVAIVGAALSKLVGEAIIHPDASLAAVKQAVQQVCGARDVTIRVNDRDIEIVAACKNEIAEILGGNELNIVADQRVSSGGCLLESSFGEIDARWETQLMALVNALRHNNNSNVMETRL